MQPVGASPELVLPGLEPAVVTQASPSHWIERGPQKRLMVFSGRSHTDLAERIAQQLGVELGEAEAGEQGGICSPWARVLSSSFPVSNRRS
jgi:hypothetical protein